MNYNNQNGYYPYYQQPNQEAMRRMIMQNQIKLGKKQQRKEIIKTGLLLGGCLIAYLFIQTFFSQLLVTLGYNESYNASKSFQYGFNVIAVHLTSMMIPFLTMALILKKNFVAPFFPTKKIKKSEAFAWIGLGMGVCTVANLITSYIVTISNTVFGYKLEQNSYGGPDSFLACIVLVVSTMIVPAICEEIALRCCALGVLRKFGKGFSVFAVSIVFGLMHGNAVQFIFAFLVGLILAFITIKTDNIVLAMLVHGLNNGISVVSQIIEYAINQKVADTVTLIIFYIWIVAGIVSVIYLAIKKRFKTEKTQKSIYDNSFIVKLACLVPGLFLPFCILIWLTSQYVTKV